MHGPLLSRFEGKRLSYKNTTGEIIDLHLFIWDEAEHLPAVSPVVCARGSQRCHRARLSFLRCSKPRTGAAICFRPPLNFIYSPSLAIKPKIYDLLFN